MSPIRRIFTLVLGALAMVAVALLSAFIAMRLAIHGREAVVPALTGLTLDEAARSASSKGLHLTLENRFYASEVPAGRILAQDPEPGSRVRREWPVRITESLGTQRVSIPDLTGESERAATVSIRRLSLDLGTVSHLAVPGDPDVVLSQTPPANSAGVDSPRLSLLVSDPEDPQTSAFVMPSLGGLTYAVAAEHAAAAGLHLVVIQDAPAPANPEPAVPGTTPTLTPNPSSTSYPTPASPLPPASPTPVQPAANAVVAAQTPQPGRRVVRGEAVHILLRTPAMAPVVSPQ